MTTRKLKGITIGLSGFLGLVVGVVLFATDATPEWVPIALHAASAVLGILGFTVVYPDTE